MRILHVLNHSYRLNGNVHAAVDLACAQARLGHDVAMCSGGGSFDALLAANHVATVVIDQTRNPLTLMRAAIRLSRFMRRWRADVVHAHMMTSAMLAWPACRLARVPLVTTVHNEFQKSSILMGVGDRVIAVSQTVGRSMRRRGIPAARLRVVLNGTIGAARLEGTTGAARLEGAARAEGTIGAARAPGSASVVFVGGLHVRKGVSDLLEAFSAVSLAHPAARLTIVGEGPGLGQYQEAAAAMACAAAVSFAGAQDNPRCYLLGADIFVLPSHADPAPLVISEAREAGCAIVATDVDGIPELLDHGNAGILVPARNPARLAAAIAGLLADPEALALWRRNSQINIDYLSVARVAQETIEVYREVVPKLLQ